MLRVVVVTIAIAGLACHQAEGSKKEFDLVAIGKMARPSVVRIVVANKNYDPIGEGTGFFLSKTGKLMTNYHVIRKGVYAVVKTEKGRLLNVAGVIGVDTTNDLALLQVEIDDAPFLSIGSTTNLEEGSQIAVIGNPLGFLEGTLSDGVVSAIRDTSEQGKWIQITAPISPGSSGSPVLDKDGLVIGVAASTMLRGQMLNRAIPAEMIALLLSIKPAKLLSLAEIQSEQKESDRVDDPPNEYPKEKTRRPVVPSILKPPPYKPGDPLSLDMIKYLSQSGVSDELIISQIRTSRTAYKLTPMEVVDLKDSGVSQRVIDFMINTPSLYPPPPPPPRRGYYY